MANGTRNSRANQWDYPQTIVIGLGTPKNPERFRVNINTKGNAISHDDYNKEEQVFETIVGQANQAFTDAGINLQFTVRAPFDPDASIPDESLLIED